MAIEEEATQAEGYQKQPIWVLAGVIGLGSAFLSSMAGNVPGAIVGLGLFLIGIAAHLGRSSVRMNSDEVKAENRFRNGILLVGGLLFVSGAVWYPFFL